MEDLLGDVLSARQTLKRLLGSAREEGRGRWIFETESYKFCRLNPDVVSEPSYGFGVLLKETNRYAYWYRDRTQPDSPLRVFSCSSRFDNPQRLL